MYKHYLDIVGKWAFIFAYNIGEDNLDEIGEWIEALGASRKEIKRTQRLLQTPNKGFTFSKESLRMSVVCIGNTTSLEQWWDTLSHEIDHLQDAVMQYYDISPGTEDAAWLQGYIMRLIVKALQSDGTMFQ
jgi:hypothetical protein